jgi:hypothetical protein
MPKKTGKVNLTINQMLKNIMLVANEASSLPMRAGQRNGPDPRRDLNAECGYPTTTGWRDYLDMFLTDGLAKKIVGMYPNACFEVDPDIYESEDPELTPFETRLEELSYNCDTDIIHYAHRLDEQSGIGSYGGLFIGVNDNKDLDKPAFKVDKLGRPIPNAEPVDLMYFRVYHQGHLTIDQLETDPLSPRAGKPKFYQITVADLNQNGTVPNSSTVAGKQHKVHWTRVLHAADNRTSSEVEGVERLRPCYNRVLDVQKILGSSAEMFYKGGFPGLSIELDPRALEALNIEIDFDAVEDEMEAYMNGLQRYIALVGMKATSLAPQIANPTEHIGVQLQAIAMALDIPLRIFIGSEAGQLASSQDVKMWNRRVHRRQHRYVSPMILRPLIDRLIVMGVLPAPAGGMQKYKIVWPDLNQPDDDEKSQIADRNAAAIMKYMMSEAWRVMQPSDFFIRNLGWSKAEVDSMMANFKKGPEIEFSKLALTTATAAAEKPKGPADSGGGRSPSDPPPGGVTD